MVGFNWYTLFTQCNVGIIIIIISIFQNRAVQYGMVLKNGKCM